MGLFATIRRGFCELSYMPVNHVCERSGKGSGLTRRLPHYAGSRRRAVNVGRRPILKSLIPGVAALGCLAMAAPASAQTANLKANASARLIKPLTLTAERDLNFGTIVMGAVTANEAVTISGSGAVTCGTSGALTCTGFGAQPALPTRQAVDNLVYG